MNLLFQTFTVERILIFWFWGFVRCVKHQNQKINTDLGQLLNEWLKEYFYKQAQGVLRHTQYPYMRAESDVIMPVTWMWRRVVKNLLGLTRLGKAHRSHTFRECYWLSQLQQCDVVVVSVDVEIPVSDYGRYGTHDWRRVCSLVLVVVAQEHPNLWALQPVDRTHREGVIRNCYGHM
jgi:hypothetical protein